MGELRDKLTNTALEHWMALFNMYPIGEEAMDLRFASVTATLQSGIPTVQVKRGKDVKIKSIFKREFWVRPRSTKALSNKIMAVFKGLGMEVNKNGS